MSDEGTDGTTGRKGFGKDERGTSIGVGAILLLLLPLFVAFLSAAHTGLVVMLAREDDADRVSYLAVGIATSVVGIIATPLILPGGVVVALAIYVLIVVGFGPMMEGETRRLSTMVAIAPILAVCTMIVGSMLLSVVAGTLPPILPDGTHVIIPMGGPFSLLIIPLSAVALVSAFVAGMARQEHDGKYLLTALVGIGVLHLMALAVGYVGPVGLAILAVPPLAYLSRISDRQRHLDRTLSAIYAPTVAAGLVLASWLP